MGKQLADSKITKGSSTNESTKLKQTNVIEEKSSKPPGNNHRFSRKFVSNDLGNNDNPNFNNNNNNSLSSLCQQLLAEGFVQSYVDFYHLTHRSDPKNNNNNDNSSAISLTLEETLFLRDHLVRAEQCRRLGDTANVYSAFTRLADLFVSMQDWRTAFFFHEKCLEVSQLTNDIRAEMTANHSLGCIYQLMMDFDGAKKFHERHEEIATSVDVFEEIAKANSEIFKVYLVLGERLESQGNLDTALEMFQRCLQAAKKSWDRAAEGEANGKIGNLLLSRGEPQESLPFLRSQSQIAADLGYAEGRCRACSSLSVALDALGLADKALGELTLVHSISEQAGDVHLQAQACKALGTLYSKLGKLEEAVEMLTRHFNLVKTILYRSGSTDSKLVISGKDLDLARVYIGIAKGNLSIGSYVISLKEDLSSLLDWKLNRTDIVN